MMAVCVMMVVRVRDDGCVRVRVMIAVCVCDDGVCVMMVHVAVEDITTLINCFYLLSKRLRRQNTLLEQVTAIGKYWDLIIFK